MLWDGKDDPYHDPMEAFAKAHGLQFLSLPGNHLSTMALHGRDAAERFERFFVAAEARST